MSFITFVENAASITMLALFQGFWLGLLTVGVVWLFMSSATKWFQLNAATRYAVWLSTLMFVTMTPLTPLLQGWLESGVLSFPSSTITAEKSTIEDTRAHAERSSGHARNGPPGIANVSLISTAAFRAGGAINPPGQQTYLELPQSGERGPDGISRQDHPPGGSIPAWRLVLPNPDKDWLVLLFALWIFIVCLRLARLARCCRALGELKKNSRPLQMTEENEALRLTLTGNRSINVGVSAQIETPLAAGFRKPMILLPEGLVSQLSDGELRQVLLHEMAHIHRRDDWTNLCEKIVEAVFFFQPAVFLIGRWLKWEREIACDDWVVHTVDKPKSYARCLARLVELNLTARPPYPTPGMSCERLHVARRIKIVLGRRRQIHRFSKTAYAVAICFLALLTWSCWWISPSIVFAQSDSGAKPSASPINSITALYEGVAKSSKGINPGVPLGSSVNIEGELSIGSWLKILASAGRINADGDKAAFLVESSHLIPADDRVVAAFLDASGKIRSTSDKKRALSALLARPIFSDENLIRFFETLALIRSDDIKAQLLIAASSQMTGEEGVRLAFQAAAKTIRSPEKYRRVISSTDAVD